VTRIESARHNLLGVAWPVFLLLALAGGAQAKDTIKWAMLNIPPLWISEGPDKGLGIQDQLTHFLESRLSGYDHEEVAAPIARVTAEMQAGQHWCTQFIRKPEREKWAYFSIPALMVLPNGIVVRKNELGRFERFGSPLLLQSLLADHSLRFSVENQRAYGPLIDALLKKQPPTLEHSDTTLAINMLLAKRIDYLIESPVVAAYSAKQLEQQSSLVTLPIKEGGLPYLVRVACPKNAWGKHVIEEVDAILRVERAKPEFRQMMERWHDENGLHEIRRNYAPLFLKSD
jgi:uncharacterized protein (TIGR02285 family)